MLAIVGVAALAGAASAQRVEYAGKVTAAESPYALHQAGDARYLALTPLLCPNDCFADVLDLATRTVHRVTTPVATLEHRFGHRVGPAFWLDGQVASYTPERTGLFLSDDKDGTTRYSYAELDTATGRLVRDVELGTFKGDADQYFAGTDSERGVAWFYLEQYRGPRRPDHGYRRERSASSIAFRKLDLRTLALSDVIEVDLPERVQSGPLEIQLFVHPADDFSHFAVVEYWENPHPITPAAGVYIVDPVARTSFAVAAPPVAYGAAFSRDGKYLYMASDDDGSLSRVDLAKRAIDRVVTGPKVARIAVAPGDRGLVMFGTSKRYVTFALPGLTAPRELRHVPELAPAFDELFDAGVISRDGRYIVIPQRRGETLGDTDDYVIGRITE